MELISQYYNVVIKEKEESLKLEKISGAINNWNTFQEDDSWSISVFAGRRSGKTYNIILKALRSPNDCSFFVGGVTARSTKVREIERIATQLGMSDGARTVTDPNRNVRLIFANGKVMSVFFIDHYYARLLHGLDLRNQDVFFDDFDENSTFHYFLNEMKNELNKVGRIICVGSIKRTNHMKAAKEWFRKSQSQYAIDTPAAENILHNDRIDSHYETLFPSYFVNEYIDKSKETAYFKGFAS